MRRIMKKNLKIFLMFFVAYSLCIVSVFGRTIDKTVVKKEIPAGSFLGLSVPKYTIVTTNKSSGIAVSGFLTGDLGVTLILATLKNADSAIETKGGNGGTFRVGYYSDTKGHFEYENGIKANYDSDWEVGFEYQYIPYSIGGAGIDVFNGASTKYSLYLIQKLGWFYLGHFFGLQQYELKLNTDLVNVAVKYNVPFYLIPLGVDFAINETISIVAEVRPGVGLTRKLEKEGSQLVSTGELQPGLIIDYSVGVKLYL